MEPHCSLQCSQEPFTCAYLTHIGPVHTTPFYLRSILILSSHLRLGLPSALFPSGFPNKSYMHSCFPMRATNPSYLILFTWSFHPNSCHLATSWTHSTILFVTRYPVLLPSHTFYYLFFTTYVTWLTKKEETYWFSRLKCIISSCNS
jgi:hypothetical protein